jgi:hypothetical protein
MKNGILVSLLVFGLAACGGESNTSAPTLSINTELSAGIKGLEAQPVLVNAEISEGDSAVLNTNYTGNVLDGSSVHFNFTLAEDKQVALFLSSESEDLHLTAKGYNIDLIGSFYGSTQLIIFDAVAGENYAAHISSIGDESNFQLKFIEANRSSVNLDNNEYLISLESTEEEKCIFGRIEENNTRSSSSFVIINWSAGYIDYLYRGDRLLFSSVNGDEFTIDDISNPISGGRVISYWQDTFTLLTDFLTGAVTGTSNTSFEYSEAGNTSSCTYARILTGHVIL